MAIFKRRRRSKCDRINEMAKVRTKKEIESDIELITDVLRRLTASFEKLEKVAWIATEYYRAVGRAERIRQFLENEKSIKDFKEVKETVAFLICRN